MRLAIKLTLATREKEEVEGGSRKGKKQSSVESMFNLYFGSDLFVLTASKFVVSSERHFIPFPHAYIQHAQQLR